MARTSSRKRTAVSYAEADSEDVLDIESDYQESNEAPSKKRKVQRSFKSLPKVQTFPFFNLPREIRDQIYRHCLHDTSEDIFLINGRRRHLFALLRVNESEMDGLQTDNPHHGIKRGHSGRATSSEAYESMNRFAPHLLRVCKAISREAIEMLYRDHTFHFDHPASLFLFCTSVGSNLQLIKSVHLRAWPGNRQGCAWNYTAMMVLGNATNLQKLCFQFTRSGYCGRDEQVRSEARALLSAVAPFAAAFGIRHGRADAAVDIVEIYHPRGRPTYWGLPSPKDIEERKVSSEIVKDEMRKLLLLRR